MRISDWSSDVCSSDLPNPPLPSQGRELKLAAEAAPADMRLIPAPTPTSQTLPAALHPPRTRRPADDRQHDVLRCHGGHDPPSLRFAVDLPDRLFPQLLRGDRPSVVPVAERAGCTSLVAAATLPGSDRNN